MKKFLRIVTSLVLVVCSVFSLAACGKKAEEADKVTKVKLNNVQSFYQTTDSPAFDEMTLTITTTKSGELTLTKGQFDLTEVSQAAEDTEFVLFTDGLYAETAGALTEGTYKFSVYVVSYGQTFENFLTVTVTDDLSQAYNLVMFKDPAFVKQYKEQTTSETDRSQFYQAASYEVGDDNPFKFKPLLSVVSKETDEIVEPDFFNVDVTVKENGTAVGSEVYTYSNFGFQFTSAAVGHTYTISVVPTDFTADEDGVAVTPATLTVTVRDGYNVSQENVKDLGRMGLVSSNFSTADRINGYNGDSTSGGYNPDGYRYVGADSEDIYYNPTGDADHRYRQDGNTFDKWAEQFAIWAQTDSHYANATAVNGIFIHGNISVTPDDLPAAFFISEEEAANAGIGSNYEDYKHLIGTPRDFTFFYAHYMDGEAFTFNGNLFKLDFSAIPFGLTNRDTGITGTNYYYTSGQTSFAQGHTTIFSFIGRGNNTVSTQATFKNVDLAGNFTNINNISGDSVDMKASGSLIGFKSISASTSVSNCLVRSCLIGMYSEFNHRDNGMALDHCKVFDCYNSGLFSWCGENNTLVHSEIRRFGGPAIFVVSEANDDDYHVGSMKAPASFTVDDESVVESYVVGDEVWFILNGAVGTAGLFKGEYGVNGQLAQYGVTFITEVDGKEKINMMGLFMDQFGPDPVNSRFCMYGGMSFGGSDLELLDGTDYMTIMDILQAIEEDQDPSEYVAALSSPVYQLFFKNQSGIMISNGGSILTVGFDGEGHAVVNLVGQLNTGLSSEEEGKVQGDLLYAFLPTNPTNRPLPNGFLVLALQLEHLA
ncbi:MAG: hypothetical protein J6X00_00040 [Clostridia bacterium]|nr:hypothetical protein [Clostridia bacterium]